MPPPDFSASNWWKRNKKIRLALEEEAEDDVSSRERKGAEIEDVMLERFNLSGTADLTSVSIPMDPDIAAAFYRLFRP